MSTPGSRSSPSERRPRFKRGDLSVPALVIALLLITVAGARCGHDAKSEKGPANTGTASHGATGGATPTDWDGKSDWDGSQWEVVDE